MRIQKLEKSKEKELQQKTDEKKKFENTTREYQRVHEGTQYRERERESFVKSPSPTQQHEIRIALIAVAVFIAFQWRRIGL